MPACTETVHGLATTLCDLLIAMKPIDEERDDIYEDDFRRTLKKLREHLTKGKTHGSDTLGKTR